MSRIDQLKAFAANGQAMHAVTQDEIAALLAIAEAFRAEVDRAEDYFREEHQEAYKALAELNAE